MQVGFRVIREEKDCLADFRFSRTMQEPYQISRLPLCIFPVVVWQVGCQIWREITEFCHSISRLSVNLQRKPFFLDTHILELGNQWIKPTNSTCYVFHLKNNTMR